MRAPSKFLCSAPKLALVSGSRRGFSQALPYLFLLRLVEGWNFDFGFSWSVVM